MKKSILLLLLALPILADAQKLEIIYDIEKKELKYLNSKEHVRLLKERYESIKNFNDLKEGDTLEPYEIVKVARKL